MVSIKPLIFGDFPIKTNVTESPENSRFDIFLRLQLLNFVDRVVE